MSLLAAGKIAGLPNFKVIPEAVVSRLEIMAAFENLARRRARFALLLALAPGPALALPQVDCPTQPADGGIEIVFSPTPADAGLRAIERVVASAKTSLDVAAYEFSSANVARALLAAHGRGVRVRLLVDGANFTKGRSQASVLAAAGLPVRVTAKYPAMHDKFIIADQRTVQTGSFNYSFSAERRNAENIVILWNNTCAAELFTGQFDGLWEEGQP
jgi:phosphatidylserine/phosphatidylglycerophosphate/cardiolipin synthase-like enzyme